MITITIMTIMTIVTPGDGRSPGDASDRAAFHYRSLEQPARSRVQLWLVTGSFSDFSRSGFFPGGVWVDFLDGVF